MARTLPARVDPGMTTTKSTAIWPIAVLSVIPWSMLAGNCSGRTAHADVQLFRLFPGRSPILAETTCRLHHQLEVRQCSGPHRGFGRAFSLESCSCWRLPPAPRPLFHRSMPLAGSSPAPAVGAPESFPLARRDTCPRPTSKRRATSCAGSANWQPSATTPRWIRSRSGAPARRRIAGTSCCVNTWQIGSVEAPAYYFKPGRRCRRSRMVRRSNLPALWRLTKRLHRRSGV